MTLKFIIDESSGVTLSSVLSSLGHDCINIAQMKPGIEDHEILDLAFKENRILITNDKDFGELIYRKKSPHKGIILLRLGYDTPQKRIQIIEELIERFGEKLKNRFIVASEKGFRIR